MCRGGVDVDVAEGEWSSHCDTGRTANLMGRLLRNQSMAHLCADCIHGERRAGDGPEALRLEYTTSAGKLVTLQR